MDFRTLLLNQVHQHANAVAVYDADGSLSYRQLSDESERLARLLRDHGAQRGDRLALWMPSCSAWLALFMACAQLGMTVVAVNTRYKTHEVEHLLKRSRSRWLAMWPSFKALPFIETLNRVPSTSLEALHGVLVFGEGRSQEVVPGIPTINSAETARMPNLPVSGPDLGRSESVVYATSGTTSAPKLVVHDQQTLIAHATDAAQFFGIAAGDVMFQGAPLCGTFGLTAALATLAAGGAIVVLPVLSPEECALQLKRHGVTHTFLNNELFSRILDQVLGEDRPFPTLRVVGFASFAPSLEDLPGRATRLGIRMIAMYGSSELQALMASRTVAEPVDQRRTPGGTLVSPAAEVRVRDLQSGQLLPLGSVGELEIKAPSLMRGYMDDEAATRRVITADGFFRTGDLGFAESVHRFTFTARNGEYLRLSGFLVNPLEIETFIQSLEGVSKCQVVGVENAGKMVVVAFVVLQGNSAISERSIIASCVSGMAKFKVPARVFFVDAFPVVEGANSTKIKKTELLQQAKSLLNAVSS